MPEPDVEAPDLIEHPFVPYQWGDDIWCCQPVIRNGVRTTCGRPEYEHEHARTAGEGDHERAVDA